MHDGAPLLLPTRNNVIRGRIDGWFESRDLRSDVVREFDDNALLIGELDQVHEQFYAMSNERKVKHPAVEAILSAIHGRVLYRPGVNEHRRSVG